MDIRIKALEEWGCSTGSALERLFNDEEFYLELLMEFTKEPGFDMLSVALDEGRVKAAFELSHMLKGVAANLGLSPIYGELASLTDDLRGEADLAAAGMHYGKVSALYGKFRNIMGEDV